MGKFGDWMQRQLREDDEMPGPLPGLEGPFRFRSGKILYYDPKEGKYYDRSTDMYVDNDEMQFHLEPSSRPTIV